MSTALTLLEETSRVSGVSQSEILKLAGLSTTAHYHWRRGASPRRSTTNKVKRVARELATRQQQPVAHRITVSKETKSVDVVAMLLGAMTLTIAILSLYIVL